MKRPSAVAVCAICTAALAGAAPAQVRVESDVDYVPSAEYANKKDRLDLYIPAGARQASVVISIHGGALRQGDKSEETFIGQRFAAAGHVTAVINYRLSPGVAHPAYAEDAAAAVAWVHRNVARYGGDPGKIFVIGHSAGAYLAALLALDDRYLATQGLSPRMLRGVAPVSAFFYVDRTGVAPDRPKDTWGTDVNVWKDASPAKYVRRDAPPLLVLYADGDEAWRRQQQKDFVADLRAAGAPAVDLQMIEGRDHMGIWHRMADDNDPAALAILRFIDARLKPSSQ